MCQSLSDVNWRTGKWTATTSRYPLYASQSCRAVGVNDGSVLTPRRKQHYLPRNRPPDSSFHADLTNNPTLGSLDLSMSREPVCFRSAQPQRSRFPVDIIVPRDACRTLYWDFVTYISKDVRIGATHEQVLSTTSESEAFQSVTFVRLRPVPRHRPPLSP